MLQAIIPHRPSPMFTNVVRKAWRLAVAALALADSFSRGFPDAAAPAPAVRAGRPPPAPEPPPEDYADFDEDFSTGFADPLPPARFNVSASMSPMPPYATTGAWYVPPDDPHWTHIGRKSLGSRAVCALPMADFRVGAGNGVWNTDIFSSAARTMVSLVRHDGEIVMRTRFPRGSGTSRSHVAGGMGFRARPRACIPATDVTMHYDLYFDPKFDWSKGGKLPGMTVGEGAASGGHHSATAASLRLMWVADGYVIGYLYVPAGVEQSDAYKRATNYRAKYGHVFFRGDGLRFRRGEWNSVSIRLALNGFSAGRTPRPDGKLFVTVNGREAGFTQIIWRRTSHAKISDLSFGMFFGGTWTCPRDTWVLMRAVSVVRHD